jgi:hypothetical protein
MTSSDSYTPNRSVRKDAALGNGPAPFTIGSWHFCRECGFELGAYART